MPPAIDVYQYTCPEISCVNLSNTIGQNDIFVDLNNNNIIEEFPIDDEINEFPIDDETLEIA